MDEKDEEWVILTEDSNLRPSVSNVNSSFATVHLDRPISKDEWDESDPLNSNTVLEACNLSDREAIVQVVTNHGSTFKPQVPPSSSNRHSSSQSLRTIRMKLESKQSIQRGLIDHPMKLFPRAFLFHFISCLWNAPRTKRVGITLVLVGFTLQSLVLILHITSRSMLTSLPSLILLGIISFLFIGPRIQGWINSLNTVLSSSTSPLDIILPLLESSNISAVSRRFFYIMILGSTLFQMRVITFLAYTVIQQVRWLDVCVISIIHCFILTYRHFRIVIDPQTPVEQDTSTDDGSSYTLLLYFSSKRFRLYRKSSSSSLDWRTDAYVFLYLTALILSWISPASSRATKYSLGAPFCIATGCFFMSFSTGHHEHDFDDFADMLRYSLRLTIRDVMISVGDNISQDEMLQIALLRWIVDYWSVERIRTAVPKEEVSRQTIPITKSDVPVATQATAQVNPRDPSTAISWDDLSSMLSSTIYTLQNEIQTREQAYGTNSSTTITNFSLFHLRKMLDALDVDANAKPAVMAYKEAIENFPPTKDSATAISLMRRCPAFLSVLYLLSIGSRHAPILFISLLPMMCTEFLRIQLWLRSCWIFSATDSFSNQVCFSLPENIDTMYILLSGDHDIDTPPLLQVWRNVVSSVHALESGLVAARYVHTAHVATKVASNVRSLAELAWAVKDKGLMHGVSTVAAELLQDHSAGPSLNRPSTKNATQYSRAVVDLFKNGQTLSRNISHLWEEKKRNQPSNDINSDRIHVNDIGKLQRDDKHGSN